MIELENVSKSFGKKRVLSNINLNINKGEMLAIAFMVVTDENMIQVRDALKPHRGEIYTESQKS